MLDTALQDWSKTVGPDIIRYLPTKKDSLFAPNNGKERCLRDQDCFSGDHFATLPLFQTVDGRFLSASEVVSFESVDKIERPDLVHAMLGLEKALFLPPRGFSSHKYGIEEIRNVLEQLFRAAMARERVTDSALRYLERMQYPVTEELIHKLGVFTLSETQIAAIQRYGSLFSAMQSAAVNSLLQRKLPNFSVEGVRFISIHQIIEDFQREDAPDLVAEYLRGVGDGSVCLPIGTGTFMPCCNGLILSADDPLGSLAELCKAVDPKNTFSVRILLRQHSRELDQFVTDDSIRDDAFFKELRDRRLLIRDILGGGYSNYIELILKSGTDTDRFIYELLQNADDAEYPEGVTPTFRLTVSDGMLTTEYNELGFKREHVRAITAIGESTKNA